jgi:GNAT superfamily N-acetyltransferase
MIRLTQILTENIDRSKLRVKTATIGGLLVYMLYYDTKKIGALRLKPRGSDYRVHGVVVYDRWRGQGFGTGLYKFAIRKLAQDAKKLYSDYTRSAEATNIWNRLVADGLAEKNPDGTYVSVI